MFFSGRRLKAAREFSYKTIDGLINALENDYRLIVTKGMVSRWENDKAIPRNENLTALCSCLGVSLNYLTDKPNLTNEITFLRLTNKLSIKELSELSEIDEQLFEYVEKYNVGSGYLSNAQLKKVGSIFNIADMKSYLRKEGILEPLTTEDFNSIISGGSSLIKEDFDLKYLLIDSDYRISYGDIMLTMEKREKFKKFLHFLLLEDIL